MPNLFGWDLLFSSVEKDIKSNQDILVCLTHLVLVSNGFKCIGLGDSKNFDGSEAKSEALPKGWTPDYALRYVNQGRLYLFKGTRLDDGIIMNLVRVDERNVAMVQLNSRLVCKRHGLLDEMIPDNGNVVDIIKKQLIDKVVVSTKTQDGSSQTQPGQDNRGVPISPLCEPRSQSFPGRPLLVNPTGGIGVGGNDLHPFGPTPVPMPGGGIGGGGMLFTGPGMGGPLPGGPGFGGPNMGMPPGAIPPGARFDPFRPPDVDRFPGRIGPRRPDNDEFPPPGFDDMYM